MNSLLNLVLVIIGVYLLFMVFFKDRTPATLPEYEGMHSATLAAG